MDARHTGSRWAVGVLVAALAVMAPASAGAQADGWTYLEDDRASLFDLGVVTLEMRFHQIAQRRLLPAGAAAVVTVEANRARKTLAVTVAAGAGAPDCATLRAQIQDDLFGEGAGSDRAAAAARAMDRAFLHRGVVSQVSPTVVGIDVAERTTLTVTSGGETCSGNLAE